MNQRTKARGSVPPLSGDLARHIFAKRPRCKRCGSAQLRTYKSLPRDGDAICRYVRCIVCNASFVLLMD